eukprot:CAMPEP_0182424052 /NCGR_PEP_ID=MMETSP1167-20130531/10187_1 /TAXON_ID=2988 /ORGANISM="Mallomonas Sp, Strain CCMP3275" /LENGTH=425 /DNA_ID=CAMNT_0024603561 /DNA_START=567 /DNA_END=1844 /DNA_ORIENTATION=+
MYGGNGVRVSGNIGRPSSSGSTRPVRADGPSPHLLGVHTALYKELMPVVSASDTTQLHNQVGETPRKRVSPVDAAFLLQHDTARDETMRHVYNLLQHSIVVDIDACQIINDPWPSHTDKLCTIPLHCDIFATLSKRLDHIFFLSQTQTKTCSKAAYRSRSARVSRTSNKRRQEEIRVTESISTTESKGERESVSSLMKQEKLSDQSGLQEERERERERDRETEKEKGRERERETEKEGEKETQGEKEKETEREKETEEEKEEDINNQSSDQQKKASASHLSLSVMTSLEEDTYAVRSTNGSEDRSGSHDGSRTSSRKPSSIPVRSPSPSLSVSVSGASKVTLSMQNEAVRWCFRCFLSDIILHVLPSVLRHYPREEVIACDVDKLLKSIPPGYEAFSVSLIDSPVFINLIARHGLVLSAGLPDLN